ncbi:MAG TPA: RIP metalloprotease RseP, partial [Rhizomicrobium sp.]|nr:RIP metalloprotease RseP [Rhizomicrobium sp.]
MFVISVVVFFHELGHFAMARAFGVKVETFSIGFGSKIFGWVDSKGTQWKVSWLPFGGYVKFLGDMNAASVPDREQIEGMDEEARRNTFAFKPLYQRALIVFAGPLANFILAIAIFAVVFMFVGRQIIPSVVDQVKPDSAAAHAGLLPGDVIATVNGSHIDGFSELQSIVAMSAGESLTLGVERGGKTITLHATPQLLETKDRFGD